jgi:hypothetical protein
MMCSFLQVAIRAQGLRVIESGRAACGDRDYVIRMPAWREIITAFLAAPPGNLKKKSPGTTIKISRFWHTLPDPEWMGVIPGNYHGPRLGGYLNTIIPEQVMQAKNEPFSP